MCWTTFWLEPLISWNLSWLPGHKQLAADDDFTSSKSQRRSAPFRTASYTEWETVMEALIEKHREAAFNQMYNCQTNQWVFILGAFSLVKKIGKKLFDTTLLTKHKSQRCVAPEGSFWV